MCLLATAVFLSSAAAPVVCEGSGSVLKITQVRHDTSSIEGRASSFAPPHKDVITISGVTNPKAEVNAYKLWYGTTTSSRTAADSNGHFEIATEFDVGPGLAEDVKNGLVAIKLRSGNAETDVNLIEKDITMKQTADTGARSNSWGKTYASDLMKRAFPHNFVAQHNDWLWYTCGSESQLADDLAKFDIVTLHYVDTSEHIAAIKERNPDVKVFAYFNPLLVYKSQSPTSEWQQFVQNHPDWWLNGLTDYGNTEQVMDITKLGWNDRCVAICKEALAKGFDGLYIDNGIQYPRDSNPAYGYTSSDSNWLTAMNYLLKRIHFNGFPVFYNGQSPMMKGELSNYLERTDGWMDEGYISYKGWRLSAIDMPYYASQWGKFTMFYAVGGDRYFYFLSSLLSDGYFYYGPTSTQWFPDYRIKLGRATSSAYYKDGIWQRDFEYGKVLVNPSSEHVDVHAQGYRSGASASLMVRPYSGVILTGT